MAAKGVSESVKKLGRMGINKSGTASVAYGIVHTEDGRYIAAEFHSISFKDVVLLEPNGRPEYRGSALERIIFALTKRTMAGRSRAEGWLPRRLRR